MLRLKLRLSVCTPYVFHIIKKKCLCLLVPFTPNCKSLPVPLWRSCLTERFHKEVRPVIWHDFWLADMGLIVYCQRFDAGVKYCRLCSLTMGASDLGNLSDGCSGFSPVVPRAVIEVIALEPTWRRPGTADGFPHRDIQARENVAALAMCYSGGIKVFGHPMHLC